MNSLYGITRNKKFSQIWETAEEFKTDYSNCGIPATISEDSITTLYYLLYAQYGYSTTANPNEEQFKYQVYSIIFRYGPSWEKELEVQNALRSLSLDELQKGSTSISQHGFNPSTQVSSEDEIETVDDQSKTRYKKSKMEAYASLLTLLKTDVTTEFINRFKPLFKVVVEPELPLWYKTLVEGEEND